VKYALALLLLFYLGSASAQLTYATLYVDYDSAWTYKNLKIVPVRRKDPGRGVAGVNENIVSLSQALSRGLVTVTERGTTSFDNVHWLRFNTHSDKSVYIAGGEIIAGGRQDRMIIHDTILGPSTRDQYVPVMCVEEGRWSEKEKKFAYGNFANEHLRKVLDSTPNQVLIWREVDRQLQAGQIRNNSLAYLSRNQDKKYATIGEEYFTWFKERLNPGRDSTIVGFVAISGDKVIGSDIFAGTGLFYQQLDPLLRGYIDDGVLFGSPVIMKDPPVKRYMDRLLTDEKSQEEFVRKNGKIFRQEGVVMHVNTFVKEEGATGATGK
jgi:hypothetical protein